jgi:hypothetical protein
MSAVRVAWTLGAALLAAAAVVGACGTLRSSPARTVRIGETVRQDDFSYTVEGFTKVKSLGADADRATASGTFYIVTVLVENHAVRVGFEWEPSMVYIVDAAGREYQASAAGQTALDEMNPPHAIIDHGESAELQVAFDLPAGIDRPAVAYSNGIMMGDVFDGGAYLKARIPLE